MQTFKRYLIMHTDSHPTGCFWVINLPCVSERPHIVKIVACISFLKRLKNKSPLLTRIIQIHSRSLQGALLLRKFTLKELKKYNCNLTTSS